MSNGRKTLPFVSVTISTRNRGARIVAALESILANSYPNYDLYVVDQSSNNLTEQAIEPFLAKSNFHYLRTTTIGVSAGRNLGISCNRSEIIAVTDDDCEVAPDWLDEMVAALQKKQNIGLVLGSVIAGEYDHTAGYIPDYVIKEPFLANDLKQKKRVRGMGACLGIRRDVFVALNGFDEMLGPGSPLHSGEDVDLIIRALLAGYCVLETPKLKVIHNGFRTWKQGRSLAYRDWSGIGGALAKQLKLRNLSILRIIWYEGVVIAAFDLLKNIFIKRRLSGMMPLLALITGLLAGLRIPVNSNTKHYIKAKTRKLS